MRQLLFLMQGAKKILNFFDTAAYAVGRAQKPSFAEERDGLSGRAKRRLFGCRAGQSMV